MAQAAHTPHFIDAAVNLDETPTATTANSGDLPDEAALVALAREVKTLARDLGFTDVGISGVDLPEDEARLLAWLEAGLHGSLHYMERFGAQRARPAELKPGTLRVISVRLDYYPSTATDPGEVLEDATLGYVSRYALGRDYHRLMRNRLQDLADALTAKLGAFGHRVFVDSGPVMEKPLARNAGLGWIGKHTNLLSREAGSWFFLGELFVALPLPVDSAPEDHCGSCTACLQACPTGAIIAPYQLDARRCLSYLTIENEGPSPDEFRTALGNRIYGCDDCQLVCPWNKYARFTREAAFEPRHGLDAARLVDLFAWTEEQFLERLAGSAIRRIGHERWLRNIAVALGNAPRSAAVVAALQTRRTNATPLLQEHIDWALSRHAVT